MIVLETLGRRWYSFAFVGMLVWAAWPDGGWRRCLRFLAISAPIVLAGEYASTHSVFPYGRYDYVAPTHGRELYVSNVPVFVPVSYGVVVWAARALVVGTRPARSRAGLAVAAGIVAALIDAVVDPMTLRGSEWFFGSVYRYRAGGPWFGVPWSNFGGWVLVSATIVFADSLLGRPRRPEPDAAVVARGRVLTAFVAAFFIVLAVATRQWAIAAGTGVMACLLLSVALVVPRRFGEEPAGPS